MRSMIAGACRAARDWLPGCCLEDSPNGSGAFNHLQCATTGRGNPTRDGQSSAMRPAGGKRNGALSRLGQRGNRPRMQAGGPHKVCNLDTPLLLAVAHDEDVAWLEIAVEDPVVVQELEAVEHLQGRG